MNSEPPRVIGVLTPYTGGFYYGAILEGVQRTAGMRQTSVFALQTTGLDAHWSAEGRTLSVEAADAWIVANEAFDDPYVEHLLTAGLPLAFVHARRRAANALAVLPDNSTGTREAVAHLIAHGHRRIAFAGCRSGVDVEERYQGYVQAHIDAGLTVDPKLVLDSPANMEGDGRTLGQQLVAAEMPCTAIATGTDKLALGMLEIFRGSRFRVPHDVALVGFDDVEQAQYAEPPLSTVRQNFQAVAAAATNALLDHLDTGLPLPTEIRVPVLFVQRQSCGCLTSDISFDDGVHGAKEHAAAELTQALLRLAGNSLAGPATDAEWPGAQAIALRVQAELTGKTPAEMDYTADLWAGFLELNRDAEAIDRMSMLLDSFVQSWPDKGAPNRRKQLCRDLRVSLLRSWQGAEQKRIRLYEWVAESSARINHALARARTDEPPDLSWLRFTHAQYGCLGLWKRNAAGERVLEIVVEHGAELVGTGEAATFVPEFFPPRPFTSALRELSRQNLITVVPLKSRASNHGLLIVAAPVALELIDHVGNVGDWGERIGTLLEQVNVEQQLRQNVLLDALTGLPNRAALVTHLGELAAGEQADSVALILLDLDDFKKINDSLGHPAGDALLVQLADRLRAIAGPERLLVRLGGDEFVIVLKDVTDEHSATALAEQIHENLRQPFQLTNELAFISCSMGIVLPERSQFSAAELLRDADTAMHRAKMLGAGQHALFHRGMREQAMERQRLDVHLRRALANNEFELYYQPVVSLRSGSAVGAEALIRWNHPEQGCLAPGRFLSVAEEVGMIIPIGKWVLETACAHAAAWQRFGRPVYVNVNVSVQHLQEPGFLAFVENVLARTGLSTAMLGVELVENKLVERVDVVTHTLSELMRLGVRVAVDDFGTGYSSLAYLKNLPVDTLKIDRSFVSGVPFSVADSAIVSAVLTMGRGLGLSVVAEGVETADQLEYLVAQGCEVAQGYYFSKPVQLHHWEARLRASSAYQMPKPRAYAGFSSHPVMDSQT